MQDRSPPNRQSSLATHGRTIHWGHSRHFERARGVSVCPLLLRSLPIYLTPAFAAKGQNQTGECSLPTCTASITVMSYRPSQSIRVPALNAAAPRRKSALP